MRTTLVLEEGSCCEIKMKNFPKNDPPNFTVKVCLHFQNANFFKVNNILQYRG